MALLSAAPALLFPNTSIALPQNGVVAGGSAEIVGGANRLDINQSTNKAIIDWSAFNINSNETVRFNQPGSSSVTLNRIHDQNPSQIQGNLSANGTVMLVNPNGVVFGQGAKVDVGGLVATTSDISNENFMNGNMKFDRPGNPGAKIINNGDIKIADTGLAAFVAPGVQNNGIINARLGKVQLAAGETFTLDMYGDGLLKVAATPAVQKLIAENSGTISANGGLISLTAAEVKDVMNSAVKNSGTLEANTISRKAGKIVLSADNVENSGLITATAAAGQGKGGDVVVNHIKSYNDTADSKIDVSSVDENAGNILLNGTAVSQVAISGNYKAKGGAHGGAVQVTGGDIKLTAANIDASGNTGGGSIKIGGDYQGKGTILHASNTSVDAASVLTADAIDNGKGGTIILWSDLKTSFAGTASVRGGANGGNGGLIELSSHMMLSVDPHSHLDARAAKGRYGDFLFDPDSINITSGNGGDYSDGLGLSGSAEIDVSYINDTLGFGNVNITATNSITLNANIATGGGGSLTFAANDISLYGTISIGSGDITMIAGSNFYNAYGDFNNSGNWFIYANNPGSTYLGGMSYNEKYYSCSYGGSCPATPAGHGIYYSYTPVLYITADNAGFTYGDNPPASLTYQISGYVDGDSDALLDVTPSLSTSTNSASGAGTYYGDITLAQNVNSNKGYSISYVAGNMVIDPRGLTIIASDNSKIYGDSDPIFYAYASGMMNGDADPLAGYYTYRDSGENASGGPNAGFYYITAYGASLNNPNYSIAGYQTGNFSIGQRGITISVDSQSKTYGDSDPMLSFNVSNNVDDTGVYTYRDSGENYGGYTIHASAPNGNYYVASQTDGTLSIGQRGLDIVAGSTSKNQYDGDPGLGYGVNGLQFGDSDPTYSINVYRDSGEGPGNYSTHAYGGGVSNSNYYINSYQDGSFYINAVTIQTALTVIADNISKIYGDSDPMLTYHVDGGGSVSGVSIYRDGGENAAYYTIYVSGGYADDSTNYYISSYQNGMFQISQRGLDIIASTTGKTYGDSDSGIGYYVSGLQFSDSDPTYSVSAYRDGGESAGNYTTHVSGGYVGNGNYYINSYQDGIFSIGQRGLDITAETTGKTYGDSDPGIGYSVSGLQFSDGDPVYSVSTYRDGGENAGNYATHVNSAYSNNANYYINSYQDGTFSISQRGLDITAGTSGKTYGDSDPGIGYSISGLQFSDGDPLYSVSAYRDGGESAGNYATHVSGGYSSSGNYYINSYQDGAFSIGQRGLDIFATTTGKIYGDGDPGIGYSVSGLQFSDSDPTYSISAYRDGGENVGYYPTHVSGGYSGNSNYYINSYQDGNLEITPRHVDVTIGSYSKTYGDGDPAFGYNVSSLVGGDDLGISLSESSGGNAGSWTISSAGSNNSNYVVDNTYTGTYTISPRSFTIAFDGQSKTYGDSDPTFTYSSNGVVNGDDPGVNVTLDYYSGNAGSYTISANGNSNGNYTLSGVSTNIYNVSSRGLYVTVDNASKTYGDMDPTFTYMYSNNYNYEDPGVYISTDSTGNAGTANLYANTSNGNYYIASANTGAFYISPKGLNIVADSQSKTYGEYDPGFTYHVDGIISGDSDPIVGISVGRDGTEDAGYYNINASGGYSNNSNYTISSYSGGSYYISPRTIYVYIDNASKTYGDSDPTFSYSGADLGPIGGDPGISLYRYITSGNGEDVNSSSLIVPTGGYSMNYNVNIMQYGTFSVTPRVIDITADHVSKIYGDMDPTLTYQVSNIYNNENAQISLTRDAGENVSDYGINSYSINNPNYTIGTYNGNTLSITPRGVDIAFDTASKVYGDMDPTFTYTISNNINGEDVYLSPTRDAGEAVNNLTPYAIHAGSSNNANYFINSAPDGQLTITRRGLDLTTYDQTVTYGDAPNYSVNGLQFGETGMTNAVFSTGDGNFNAGSHTLEIASASSLSDNYEISSIGTSANLTIDQRGLDISADYKTKVYGDADPTLTYTVNGLQYSDADPTNAASISRTAGEHHNYYSISLSGDYVSNDSNYFVNSYSGNSLYIDRKGLTITADNKSKTYGAANPTFTYQVTGLIGMESNPLTGVSLTSNSTGHAGTFNISSSGGSSSNDDYYIQNRVNGSFVISAKALGIVADDKSITYGDANPTLTYQLTGLVGMDTNPFSGVSLSSNSTGHAGTYSITSSGGVSGNTDYVIGTRTAGSFVIGSKALNVIADNQTKTYGDADPAFTYHLSGLVGMDANPLSGISLSSNSTGHAGTFSITSSGGTSGNTDYTIGSRTAGSFVIGSKALGIVADNKTKTYGDADPTFTYHVTGLVGVDANPFSSVALSSNSTGHAGSFTISSSGGTSGNTDYTIGTRTGGSFVIGSKALTIIADNQTKTYGDADPTFTYHLNGLVGMDTDPLTGVTLSSNSTGHAGTFSISSASGTSGNTDYTIGSRTSGSFIIGSKALTVVADNQTKTYGDADPTFTYHLTGLVGMDADPLSGLTLASNSTGHAGTYSINSTGGASSNTDYTIGTRTAGSFIISSKALNIIADNQTKTYGDADPTFTYHVNGLVGMDANPLTGVTLSSNSTGHAGTFSISSASGTSGNADYTIGSRISGSFIIGSKALTIVADNKTKTYGDADPTFTYHLTGLVGMDADPLSGITLASNSTGHAGTHSITSSGGVSGNTDYTIGSRNAGSFIIGSKALTIVADNQTKTYGDADPTFTYHLTGLVGMDADPLSGITLASNSTGHAGTYSINSTSGASANTDYTIGTRTAGSFIISSKVLNIIADNTSKTYGAADPTFTYHVTGLVGMDTNPLTGVSLSSNSTGHAGTFSISASGGASGNADYTIGTHTGGSFIIGSKALTIIADNTSKTYGDADPTLTYHLSGLVGSDADPLSGITLSTNSTGHAGSYTVSSAGGVSGNTDYTIGTRTSGTFLVNSKALSIIADSKTKVYGAADPSFTYQVSGLVGMDANPLSGITMASNSTGHAGTFSINSSGGSSSNTDYVIGTRNAANYVITPKDVTIVADNKTKTYGTADPSFTYHINGLVNSDNAAASGLSLTSDSTGHAGDYTITASNGTLTNSDYQINGYTTGAFHIDPKTLTVVADNKTKTYGDADPAFTYHLNGLVGSDTDPLSGMVISSNSDGHAGSFTISANAAGNSNSDYTIAYNSGTFLVNKALLTITGNDFTRDYAMINPAFDGVITGFVNNETSAVLTSQPVYATNASSTSHAGSYHVTPSNAAAQDYDFNYVNGTMTVTGGPAVAVVDQATTNLINRMNQTAVNIPAQNMQPIVIQNNTQPSSTPVVSETKNSDDSEEKPAQNVLPGIFNNASSGNNNAVGDSQPIITVIAPDGTFQQARAGSSLIACSAAGGPNEAMCH